MLKNLAAYEVYYQAFEIGARIPELEPILLQNTTYTLWAYLYARDVIKDRWYEAEPIIAQDAEWALHYAAYVIKARFYAAEAAIAQYAEPAYWYATNVLHGRFPEGEPAIATDAKYACKYAIDIMQGRFIEAEEIISKSYYSTAYTELWFNEPVFAKNEVSEFKWLRFGAKGYFAPESLFEQKLISLLDNLVEAGGE